MTRCATCRCVGHNARSCQWQSRAVGAVALGPCGYVPAPDETIESPPVLPRAPAPRAMSVATVYAREIVELAAQLRATELLRDVLANRLEIALASYDKAATAPVVRFIEPADPYAPSNGEAYFLRLLRGDQPTTD